MHNTNGFNCLAMEFLLILALNYCIYGEHIYYGGMLHLNYKNPAQFLDKFYLNRVSILREPFNHFWFLAKNFITNIKDDEGAEENNNTTNYLIPFLSNIKHQDANNTPKNDFYYRVNIHEKIDTAIIDNNQVAVIIECKNPSNKVEMIEKNNFNKKSFWQAIHYFLMERKNNNSIKHIIITNYYQWFIFDAKDFENIFSQNRQINNIYNNYNNPDLLGVGTTDYIYNELEKFIIHAGDTEIDYTYFDFRDIIPLPENDPIKIAVYKIFQADGLLKKYNPNDANSLNEDFYRELLYILGLKEVKEGDALFIRPLDDKQCGNIYQNCRYKLQLLGKPHDQADVIELIIVWLNRILFCKLFESQWVSWHGKDHKFFGKDIIHNFNHLENLFFKILAVPIAQRVDNSYKHLPQKFKELPYLNSSLFAIEACEKRGIPISALDNNLKIQYFDKTAVHDSKRNRLFGEVNTLDYLLDFLDSYNFAEDRNNTAIVDQSRHLINPSVLGLIFEKINGFQDGSYFTPSYITEYMSRETIRNLAIERINQHYGTQFNSLLDIFNGLHYNNLNDYKKINQIIDSITICDPAVGSGHFLVAALNELLYIKGELGIILTNDNKRIKDYEFKITNDELVLIHLENGLEFLYEPNNIASGIIQRTLFLEKQKIIENSLFGVDLNPTSVTICRLRLWIELLKNAHYGLDGQLQTLPNIDINIKCANSLISRFSVDNQLANTNLSQNIREKIAEYKNTIKQYKNNTADKRILIEKIEQIKLLISGEFQSKHSITEQLDHAITQFIQNYGFDKLRDCEPPDGLILKIFHLPNARNIATNFFESEETNNKMRRDYEKLKDIFEKWQSFFYGDTYQNAMEWALEFPELLDDNGKFLGFDAVIGNPPYIDYREISAQTRKFVYENYELSNYSKQCNLYCYFIEKLLQLLKPKLGVLALITPQQYLSYQNCYGLRELIRRKAQILQLADFSNVKVFKKAQTYTFVSIFSNNIDINKIGKYIEFQNKNLDIIQELDFNNPIKEPVLFSKYENLIYQIQQSPVRLKNYVNEIFCASSETLQFSTTPLDFQYIQATDIQQFYLANSQKYINKSEYRKNSFSKQFGKNIIMTSRMTKIIRAVYLENNLQYLGGKINVILADKYQLFITALLNSNLINFWFRETRKLTHMQGGYFPITTEELLEIPICNNLESLDLTECNIIVNDIQNHLPINPINLIRINEIIYDLYNIAFDDREIINNYISKI